MWTMGAIWTRIWGKPSTKDLLERISVQLGDIEETKRDSQAFHKKLIGYLLLYFSALYFVAAIVAYFKYFHDPEWSDWLSQLKLFTPFLVAPLILWVVRKILTWWYHRKLRRNEAKLEKLRSEKSKLLEEVMEKETYKVAKEILDKYGMSEQLRKPPSKAPSTGPQLNKSNSVGGGAATTPIDAGGVRRRPVGSAAGSTTSLPSTTRDNLNASVNRQQMALTASPSKTLSGGDGQRPTSMDRSLVAPSSPMAHGGGRQLMGQPMGPNQRRAPGPPLPRPVLPRERGYMDKVVEYLVGDGPSNRFALICKQCQSHNGMALREEFEYIAFRCCYCFYWNPARKQRPTAPRLPAGPPASAATASSTESTDDESSASQVSTAARKSAPSAAVKANPSQLSGQARPQTTAPEGDTKSEKNPPVESNDVPADPETREPSGTEENSADEETEIVSQAKETGDGQE